MIEVLKNIMTKELAENSILPLNFHSIVSPLSKTYFRSQKEQEQLIKCHSFSIEGFIALKKKTNVYGFMCQIEQTNDGWQMIEGNTYQIYKHANITGLYH